MRPPETVPAATDPEPPRAPGLLREVSPIPPAEPAPEHTGLGVAARILPPGATRRRRSRRQLLDVAVVASRIGALAPPAIVAAVTGGTLLDDNHAVVAAAVAVAFTLLRAWRPSRSTLALLVDLAVVVAVLAASNGTEGPLVFFGIACAFALGAGGGSSLGVAGALTLALAAALTGFLQEDLVASGRGLSDVELLRLGDLVLDTIALTALFPLASVIGSLVGGVMVENRAGQAALLETNRVLSSLERLTSAAPATLSPASVATAAAAEFRRALGGDVAIVLFERAGSLVELGRDGGSSAGLHVLLDDDWQALVAGARPRRLTAHQLPQRLASQLPDLATWLAVPLRAREHRVGVVLVGSDGNDRGEHRGVAQVLHDLAAETAVALDNTQLFLRIEQVAATAERERLARDLHDGVAQQLTHVRFELELLARDADDEPTRHELTRLARVTETATDDVRAAIRGLRASAVDQGLVPALRALVTDLAGGNGPTLELDVRGGVETDPDTAAELYRIVQEALSNALRHARAEHVAVEVDVVHGTLLVAVEDDGHGLAGQGSHDGDGLGLRTMRARANRLGAQFTLRDGDEGGTRMELRMPVKEARHG